MDQITVWGGDTSIGGICRQKHQEKADIFSLGVLAKDIGPVGRRVFQFISHFFVTIPSFSRKYIKD